MNATNGSARDAVDAARVEIRRRDFDEAQRHLDDAMTMSDVRAEAFNLLGVIDEVRGDSSSARTNWRVALLLDPAYAPARENLDRSMRGSLHRDAPSLG